MRTGIVALSRRVFVVPPSQNSITIIPVGTLDNPSWVTPSMEIYCDDAQPWVQLGGGMKRFPKMRPAHG